MNQKWRWYDAFFILLFCYLLILQVQAIWPFTVDDMYISLRYARNWAAGDGLLWNVQAPPVEGYTNFSFVVLGALSLLLHFNPVIVLKSAGFVGLTGTCIFIYLISRFWFNRRESLLPCIGLLLYKGQIIWAVSGLETAVYEALVCGSVYFAYRALGYHLHPQPRGSLKLSCFILSGLFLSLAGMTRPEAPALMVLYFLLLCWDRPETPDTKHWQGVALFSATILLIYVPYFLWRWNYYGFLFPNSIYCKGYTSTASSIVSNYLKLIWPFALAALPACIWAKDKRYLFLWLPGVVYIVLLLKADPVVAFYNRLFLTAFVLMMPLSLKGLDTFLFKYLKQRDGVYAMPLYLAALCMGIFFIPSMSLGQYRYFSEYPVQGEQLRKQVAEWLTGHVKSGKSVVLADSGLIPYYSNFNFIDSYCLNNVTMAHYSESQRYDQFCYQILRERPDVIILTSLIEQGRVLYTPSDYCLKKLLDNQSYYNLNKKVSAPGPDSTYRYELFTHF